MILIPVFVAALLGDFPSWVPWLETAGPWVAAFIFTALAATDYVDGYLARSRNEVTTFGKFIDPLADKLLVAAALIALVGLGEVPAWVAIVIISRELIVSGLRMVAVAEGKVIAASKWGKAKTVAQIVAIVMFIVKDSDAPFILLGVDIPSIVDVLAWPVMIVALLLTLASMVEYFYHARDVLTGPWRQEAG
jgi:CDP-diacylglycerol--glycerol-3-phosphate 3-phosphatidyltransferase